MSKEFSDFNNFIPEQHDLETVLDAEVLKRKKEMGAMLNELTPEQQDFVTEVASVFLEKDIYDRYKKDLKGIKVLTEGLEDAQLNLEQVKIVLRYLNLPFYIK